MLEHNAIFELYIKESQNGMPMEPFAMRKVLRLSQIKLQMSAKGPYSFEVFEYCRLSPPINDNLYRKLVCASFCGFLG